MFRSFFSTLVVVAFCSTISSAQNENSYRYQVDITKINDDKLTVTLETPKIKDKKAFFHLPKMVPGTYSIYDFGRFVTNLEAFDGKGKKLKVIHEKDPNTWEIRKANKLKKIVYTVEDTWDTDKTNVIFEPAGTNIDKNVTVFNNHGIFGYIEKYDRLPMTLTIDRPANFFGGTGMKRTGGDSDTDIFEAPNYQAVVDAPILFAPTDTATFKVANTTVLIQTYSPTKKVSSKDLVKEIQPILEAHAKYLGGQLPVDRYAFLIFLNEEGASYLSGAAGALEHSYSSFYCMFEGNAEDIAQSMRDVAAHEFYHIVTPLTIHSEEIHYFDFINPKMSQHLWMYEGVTEYAAQHVQVYQGLVSVDDFLENMAQKVRQSKSFKDDLPFTELSLGALDKYKSQYSNVYLKGALIGMCLDLKLRILSKGKYGIQDLMHSLSKKYGIEKPFKDGELFAEIVTACNFPEIKDFLNNYIGAAQALPYNELLNQVGIEYLQEGTTTELSPFGISDLQGGFDVDMKLQKLKIKTDEAIDAFGRDHLKIKEGDLLHKWNGAELTLSNINTVLGTYQQQAKEGMDLNVVVMRKDANGEYKEVELKTKLVKVEVKLKHIFKVKANPTAEQLALRKTWLGQ